MGSTLTNNLSGESVGLIIQMIRGKMPVVPKTENIMVDVRDVAQLHVRTMLHEGSNGKRFIAAEKSTEIC